MTNEGALSSLDSPGGRRYNAGAGARPALATRSGSPPVFANVLLPLLLVQLLFLLPGSCAGVSVAATPAVPTAETKAPGYSRAASLFKKRMKSKDADTRIAAAHDFARVCDVRTAATLFESAVASCSRRTLLEKEHARRVADLVKFEKAQARNRSQKPGDYADSERRHLRGQVRRVKTEWRRMIETEAALIAGVAHCMQCLDKPDLGVALTMLEEKGLDRRKPEALPAAVTVAAALPDDLGVPFLSQVLASSQPVPLRVHLVDALDKANSKSTSARVDLLLRALDDAAWQVRAAAIAALSRIRSTHVIAPLIAALAREDGRLQEDLIAALTGLTGQTRLQAAASWDAWWTEACATFSFTTPETVEPAGDSNPAGAGTAGTAGTDTAETDDPTADSGTAATGTAATGTAATGTAATGTAATGTAATGTAATGTAATGARHRYGASFYGIDTRSRRIVFVLDTSGSMEQHTKYSTATKLEVAKKELSKTIRGLRPPAHINLVFFGDSVTAWRPGLVELSDETRSDALAYIDSVEAAGGTNLFDGLRLAQDIRGLDLFDANFVAGADTVFLLSDGKPNRGILIEPDEILGEVARWNEIHKVRIHTIGLGNEHNAEMMKGIAELTGGRYIIRR